MPDSSVFFEQSARWAALPEVEYVQPNRRYRVDAVSGFEVEDPLSDSLTHVPVIRADEAWGFSRGAGVRIGLIDTGVFFGHPDLLDQFWVNPGEDVNGNGRFDAADLNGVDDDGNGFIDDVQGYDFVDRATSVEQGDYLARDPDAGEDGRPGSGRGHGTSVAGVLAAVRGNGVGITGIAPEAKLVPLRAFGADGQAEDDDVVAAIVYAADLGVDVINLSFGDIYTSPLMHESIRYAVERGTVVVASAGNLGGDDPHYPSDYPEVISVAWLNAAGTSIAPRGTHGIGVELGAPGSQVYTTIFPDSANASAPLGPSDYYGRRSGSSIAAPMVAATVALLRSVEPTLTPASVRSLLTATAADRNTPGWDHQTGAGLLDAARALSAVLPGRVAITTPGHNAGVSGDAVSVHGTVVDPLFDAFELFFTPGDEDGVWTSITGPVTAQRWESELGVWNTTELEEGPYTLRLSVRLKTGAVIEDRRRVYIDRTPPQLDIKVLQAGLVGSNHGIIIDAATDDLVALTMSVAFQGEVYDVASDRKARRHGVAWPDRSRRGGGATVRITAVNSAGMLTQVERLIDLPPLSTNATLFERTKLPVKHGYLLSVPTDFDRDGLLEFTLNQYQDGWLGDTLVTYEWNGEGFNAAQRLVANVFPRDAGDSDGDGLQELLTQVSGATLLLEQGAPDQYPTQTAYLDTTGLENPFSPDAAFGARLADLDQDGKGEILVHNTSAWRVLEYDAGQYRAVAELVNPTGVSDSELDANAFQEPEGILADLDGDGRPDWLVGDSDGDWVIYEATGDNLFEAKWSVETDRYDAGSRFASGDFEGDGRTTFVTFTQNWTQATGDREQEPGLGTYYFWASTGDDQYALTDSLVIHGNTSRHGSMAAADFDGDGKDELAIIHPPYLYLLEKAGSTWKVCFIEGPEDTAQPSGVRSIASVTGDFDGDRTPELLAAHADEYVYRYVFDGAAQRFPPPQWDTAVSGGDKTVLLAWNAPGADSVVVYRAEPGRPLDRLGTTGSGTWIDSVTTVHGYALRAWYGAERSPVSELREVRPHDAAAVVAVGYSGKRTIRLTFSEPLHAGTSAGDFRLDAGGMASSLLLAEGGRTAVLRFGGAEMPDDTLRWGRVSDAEGMPVKPGEIPILFPSEPERNLIVRAFELTGDRSVRLFFSEELDPETAANPANYRLEPLGTIAGVAFTEDEASVVEVTIDGQVLGATGLTTTLEVVAMRSVTGATLASEGRFIRLVEAADNLDDVFVFPNPYHAEQHGERVMIAGLPREATVRILSATGALIRVIEEADGDGGAAWDLNDDSGVGVPSGLYLIRVESDDHKPVLRKVAVIR